MKKTVCLTLALLLLLSAFSACGSDEKGEPLFAERGEAQRAPLGELVPAADAEALLEALREAGQNHSADWDDASERAVPGVRLDVARAADGDTVATDGSYIYMLDSYGLVIFSAAGRESEILSYTRVEREGAGWSERLCVTQDRVAVVSTVSDSGLDAEGSWHDEAEVRVTLLDTADKRKPQKLADASVEGSLVEARLVDGTLCLVTEKTMLTLPESDKAGTALPRLSENDESFSLRPGDVYLCPDPAKPALTVVAAIRLEDGRFADALAFTDGTEAVCADGKDLYLARTFWSETASAPRKEAPYSVVDYSTAAQTEIKRLRLEGGLSLNEGCVLYGALSDPDAMAVVNGQLRVATDVDERSFSVYTDEKHGWSNYEGGTHAKDSQLAVLDGNLNAVGALARLGGEQGIADCRFLRSTGWITAGETLSAVDFSNPADPKVCGSFPTSGDILVLWEMGQNCVLALSLPGPEGKIRLTAYDLSDPAAPKEADSLELDELPAGDLTARGALFADAASGWIGWPAAEEDGSAFRLVHWTGSKLKDEGTVSLDYVPDNARGLLLNGLLYICSPGQVCVTDPENGKVLTTVSNAVG